MKSCRVGRIRSRPQAITNVAELETALQEEWGKIPQSQATTTALIESMPENRSCYFKQWVANKILIYI